MLAIWGPSRLHKELRNFCIIELIDQVGTFDSCDPPKVDIAYESDDSIVAYIEYNDTATLLKAASRCVLLTALIHILVSGPDASSIAAQMQSRGLTLDSARAVKYACYGLPMVRSLSQQQVRRDFDEAIFAHPAHEPSTMVAGQPWCIRVDTKDPESIIMILGIQLTVERTRRPNPGCVTASSARAPTTMRPKLAELSVNLARVLPGSVVLDPCCGSGALIVASLNSGACAALGSDIGIPDVRETSEIYSSLRSPPCEGSTGHPFIWGGRGADRIVVDATGLHLRPSCIDAILSDPPYGVRAAALITDNKSKVYQDFAVWQIIVHHLVQLAEKALVPGGRLLCWVPHEKGGRTESWLRNLNAIGNKTSVGVGTSTTTSSLSLAHYLPETRESGLLRAVAVWQKSGRRRRIKSKPKATANVPETSGTDLHASSSPTEQLPQTKPERDLTQAQTYKHIRATFTGAKADIWRAAWLGDASSIASYLKDGGDPDQRHKKDRQTPLQFAAGYGRVEAVKQLLAGGADPKIADDAAGMAPLHRAAARGHTEIVTQLLLCGGDQLQVSKQGDQTPLHYAAQFGHVGSVIALLQGIHHSCGVEKVLRTTDAQGYTALHAAAQWGMADVADILLNAAVPAALGDMMANMASKSVECVCPAHLAARWGHIAVLEVLLKHGADRKRRSGKDGQGRTPLEEAMTWRREECVSYLEKLE